MAMLLSSSSINHDSVRNAAGEDLGEIKDLMIDTETGQVEYAVLSFGGFLGMGDKYFAVPFKSFNVDRENECMVLNVEKERLKDAPGFDKDHWPNFADAAFRSSVDSYYV
ncbi:PRC-barrel domain-containing protein [Parvularcula sp. LCG005]|uniref:PRC-barrel domain-containing protein n=1 Tax=Parvularcula sp. LCG005 TaxID=3078805 RepID=UPI0029425185|nr:PRC-barrel domain-containing protein [Parvularcula sp. LCG005]WOI53731.1 PRC-barrel domain-containing protein [Parvularcula sp. LCG005]